MARKSVDSELNPGGRAAAVLRTDALTIGYRRARRAAVVVARELNFRLRPGELVCLLGPNGAGKSTLMRTLARLQPALSGQIWLDGRLLDELRPGQLARRLSVVLTERVDVGAMSGYGLVSLGRHPYTGWAGTLSERDRRAVQWALQAVRAEELGDRLIVEMSDGERQKILIARALAQEPRVMLLDEPTAFLDLPRRVEVMDLLRRLAHGETAVNSGQRPVDSDTAAASHYPAANGVSILLSTHDLDQALRTADRLWLLSADGELYDGAPEDLILNGAFERVFSAEGVTFDRAHGSFHTRGERRGLLRLRGDGVAAFWARRALERIGYAVEEAAASALRSQVFEVGDGGARGRSRTMGNAKPESGVPPQTGGRDAGAALGTVSVRLPDGRPSYMLEIAGREDSFATLDALTTHLRKAVIGDQ